MNVKYYVKVFVKNRPDVRKAAVLDVCKGEMIQAVKTKRN